MAEARAARCRVRGPQAAAGRLAALAADALRTAPDPGGRLLLLRRLDLGQAAPRGPGGDPARAALARRAAEALRQAARGAVHGGAPHAAAAGAVWFRDAAEARRLLLLRRARGAATDAWFWRLAVPEAARAPDPGLAAAARLLHEAQGAAEAEQELAGLLRAAAAQGAAPALAALLFRAAAAIAPAASAPMPSAAPAPPASPELAAEAQAEAALLLAAAPEAVGAPLRRLLRASAGAPPPRWLRRAALLAAAPGLCAAPARLETLAEALARPAPIGRPAAPAGAATPPATGRSDPAPPRPQAARDALSPAPPDPSPCLAVPPGVAEGRARPDPDPDPAPDADEERFSPTAGLLLVVTPLRKAGFAEWLAAHPTLAAEGFGPGFLLALAFRQAQGRPDALVECLAGWPAADPAPARAWRRGLDGWLRRRAGRRLHDLAGRGGWLRWSEGRIEARYPAAAADLALRRRGLDADPGWVPWLGRSLRYRFDDAPAP